MTNPKRQKVTKSAKKAELLDRTTSERNFCSVCQYYYSEMFTCPICYGAELERESIIDYLRDLQCDVLAYKEGYDIGTLQTVISWIEGRDND